ncbi:hypothetical protein [Pseudomonas saponiphila]|uniref:hypothetical protein n=1 Tax=Pseudomonas saponiphila TaxID=556534 RepID=UPI002240AA02|nr:hypothetical protein [Pseudomonas saponiphila]
MEPVHFGSKYRCISSGSSDYPLIMDPSSNVNGAVIRTISAGSAKIFTGASKPTWVNEAMFPVLMEVGQTVENNYIPIQIPAGYGLWASGSGRIYISYDLL